MNWRISVVDRKQQMDRSPPPSLNINSLSCNACASRFKCRCTCKVAFDPSTTYSIDPPAFLALSQKRYITNEGQRMTLVQNRNITQCGTRHKIRMKLIPRLLLTRYFWNCPKLWYEFTARQSCLIIRGLGRCRNTHPWKECLLVSSTNIDKIF